MCVRASAIANCKVGGCHFDKHGSVTIHAHHKTTYNTRTTPHTHTHTPVVVQVLSIVVPPAQRLALLLGVQLRQQPLGGALLLLRLLR